MRQSRSMVVMGCAKELKWSVCFALLDYLAFMKALQRFKG